MEAVWVSSLLGRVTILGTLSIGTVNLNFIFGRVWFAGCWGWFLGLGWGLGFAMGWFFGDIFGCGLYVCALIGWHLCELLTSVD